MENLSDKSFIPSNQGRVNEEMIPQGRSGIPGSQDLICIDLSRQIALPNNMMVTFDSNHFAQSQCSAVHLLRTSKCLAVNGIHIIGLFAYSPPS
ncbi:hypothetical protein TNCV_2673741 [Trichonephila clavipes]|nr:hypothetical protein TNCV_2673741 [Trichonephila clavipes]